MTDHLGRLIDHVELRVADLEASHRFYGAVLETLGHRIERKGPYLFCDELAISQASGPVSHMHLAFQAASRDEVRAFHAAGLLNGGRDNGGPGERDYHPSYYGAFVLDPDGNNVEAVTHGPVRRSARSVVVERTDS
ncbi:VOC family protein [Aureimonas sp. AU4]|uniref:VOC family protein n=1 Tax=Aureimonas sp. AU4 TaxID=1638163 RepID=UPI000780474F|nr:VOC family protein [Aureimonas sp. AU4]